MKECLHRLIDGMNEAQIMYAYTFLTKLFGKGGAVHA